jgi:sugar phosphate isomerase/epimerase
MKLSISNIAWDKSDDDYMYDYLVDMGFNGIEIAPTRVIEKNPYDNEDQAKAFKALMDKKGLTVSSMQSIWFQRSERIFYDEAERTTAVSYTKKAIDFAKVLDCNNLVFGCPKNRSYEDIADIEKGISFFKDVAAYAHRNATVFSLEPNPTIYNTNFINETSEAFAFVKRVGGDGFKVNVDFGTIVQNDEDLSVIADNLKLVNHVHISEPFLNRIEKREKHKELCAILKDGGYDGFVSIEMKNLGDLDIVKSTVSYIKEVFA